MAEIKDSGKREEFSTGSRRDTQEGKGRFDLLPWRALWQVAIHSEMGAKKYGERNVELGQKLSRLTSSAQRHGAQVVIGDCSEPHIVSEIWNLLHRLDHLCRIKEGLLPKELNDLPVDVTSQLYNLPYWPKEVAQDCTNKDYSFGTRPNEEYYYLIVGDRVKIGDELFMGDLGWLKANPGHVVGEGPEPIRPFRRKL